MSGPVHLPCRLGQDTREALRLTRRRRIDQRVNLARQKPPPRHPIGRRIGNFGPEPQTPLTQTLSDDSEIFLRAVIQIRDKRTLRLEIGYRHLRRSGDLHEEHLALRASERDGYRHLYRLTGGTAQQLTSGRWVMDELVGVDEKRGRLWFTGFADSTLEKQVYALDFRKAGAKPQRLTAPGGWHEAVMDDAGQRLIVTSSTPSQPAQVWLSDGAGKRLAWIEENRVVADALFPARRQQHLAMLDDEEVLIIKPYFFIFFNLKACECWSQQG